MDIELVKPVYIITNNTEVIEILDITFQIIGYTGGGLLSLCLIPQILKIIKTKSGNDLSYSWQFLSIIGLVLFLIYGIYFNLLPVYIPVSFELLLVSILTILKKYYYEINKIKNIKKDKKLELTNISNNPVEL